MNHLIVIGHPNPKIFNMALLAIYRQELVTRGHHVAVRDLYAMGFDPVLSADDFIALQNGRVKAEQKQVRQAEIITFISPVWWMSVTSMLKGYVDRVFSLGFAYRVEDHVPHGLLTGKKGFLITTSGATNERYEQNGFLTAFRTQVQEGILRFSGIEIIHHLHFGGVVAASQEERKNMLLEVQDNVRQHF